MLIARRGAKCSEMAFALGARAISAVESEAAKAVGGFRPARRGALCLGFHNHPETGVLPTPNRTRDLTRQRSLLHAEQNAPKRTVFATLGHVTVLVLQSAYVLTAPGHSSCSQQVARPAASLRWRGR